MSFNITIGTFAYDVASSAMHKIGWAASEVLTMAGETFPGHKTQCTELAKGIQFYAHNKMTDFAGISILPVAFVLLGLYAAKKALSVQVERKESDTSNVPEIFATLTRTVYIVTGCFVVFLASEIYRDHIPSVMLAGRCMDLKDQIVANAPNLEALRASYSGCSWLTGTL